MEIEKDIFNNEETYYISSNKLAEDVDYIIKNGIVNIGINSYKQYTLDNISQISERINFVKKIHIGCRNLKLQDLKKFESLEFLSLMDDNKDVDFSKNSKLKHLFFTFDKSFKGLSNLINLETLVVGKSSKDYHLQIKRYTKLINLELIQSKDFLLKDIINDESNYSKLSISHTKGQINLEELYPIRFKLKELRLFNCKNITSYDFLKNMQKLEVLVLSNCNSLPDSTFVDKLSNLKHISLTGNSFFEDGNIENLKKVGLTVGIDNKKHYNLKSDQFLNYFRSPPEPMPK